MKSTYLIITAIILIVVVGYLGRHQIKSMLGMGTPAPAAVQNTAASPSANPSTSSSTQSATTAANKITMTEPNPAGGNYLADSKGMTLYTFDNDTQGKSTCTGGCATIWPAFAASSASTVGLPANMGVTTRADGTFQYTWKGMPLYYYFKDKKVGDILGDGIGNIWHLVKV